MWNFILEEFVNCVGVSGLLIGVVVACFWPRIFGLEFLSYSNRLLVLNPGTGLVIVTNALCFLWVCSKIVGQKGRGANPTKLIQDYATLTVIEWASLLFYAYDPAAFIRLGAIWIIALGAMLFIAQSRTNQKPV